MLVQGEPNEQRHRVGGDELVGFVGLGEVEAGGHSPDRSGALSAGGASGILHLMGGGLAACSGVDVAVAVEPLVQERS